MSESRVAFRVDYQADLAQQVKLAGLPEPVLEFRFHPTRKFRFDLAWPDHMLACEIDGGIWVRGRHVRADGFRNDCIKGNEAILLGWRVLHVTPDMVSDGSALVYVEYALKTRDERIVIASSAKTARVSALQY